MSASAPQRPSPSDLGLLLSSSLANALVNLEAELERQTRSKAAAEPEIRAAGARRQFLVPGYRVRYNESSASPRYRSSIPDVQLVPCIT